MLSHLHAHRRNLPSFLPLPISISALSPNPSRLCLSNRPISPPRSLHLRSSPCSEASLAVTVSLAGAGRRDSKRRPKGFWEDPENRVRELRAFAEDHALVTAPTRKVFEGAGRTDLYMAVRRHGGWSVLAAEAGIAFAEGGVDAAEAVDVTKAGRRPSGYWGERANRVREVVGFCERRGIVGRVPTRRDFFVGGRGDIYHGLWAHGGVRQCAVEAGLGGGGRVDITVAGGRPHGYWAKTGNRVRELRGFAKRGGKAGEMPTHTALVAGGRRDISSAVQKYGGVEICAAEAGLVVSKVSRLKCATSDRLRAEIDWRQSNLNRELNEFAGREGLDGRMPTTSELVSAGRSDIASAVRDSGGWERCAKLAGLGVPRRNCDGVSSRKRIPNRAVDIAIANRRPPGYWANVANRVRELKGFAKRQGHARIMPTGEELLNAGRSDIHMAVNKYGGWEQCADEASLAASDESI